jgi:hypothetical protein
MKKTSILTLIIMSVIISLFAVSCNPEKPNENKPILSLTPADTYPTQTVTLTDIKPTQTLTPISDTPINLGVTREYLPMGFLFTFRPLEDMELTWDVDRITFLNKDHSLIFMFNQSKDEYQTDDSPEKIAENYINAMNNKMNGTLELSGQAKILVIDNQETTLSPVSGTLYDQPSLGATFLTRLEGKRLVFGIGLAMGEQAEELWRNEGNAMFEGLVNTFQFISIETVQRGCQISADPTYGYSEDNPVKVGGNSISDFAVFDGVRREDIYLFLLSGPNGETISYERSGSMPYGDTILDIYSITYPNSAEPKTIYIDIYNFSPPDAPMGFSCHSYFPFEEPR